MFQVLFVFLLASFSVFADVKYSLDTYLSQTDLTIQAGGVNPSNQVLQLPHSKTHVDVRPEVKWRGKTWQMVLRPRFIYTNQRSEIGSQTKTTTKNDLDLTDAFLEKNWTSKFSTTVGLQVYQWGPAEFLNSSNPFSHFNPQQKNILYKEKGKGLVRGNYSFNKENSLVIAIEPVSSQTPEWIAQDRFTPKGFLKYEKSWSGTLNSVGLTLGKGEKNNPFVGEYFSYYIKESTSIYADVKQQQNNVRYEPVWNGSSYDMEVKSPDLERWNTLAVAGLRFEQAFDFRIEYVYNGAGYDKDQLKQAVASAANFFSTMYAQNAARFFKPGLEIFGKNYLYSSFRVTDPAWISNFSFYMRWLYSLQDDSSQVQLEVEKSFFDSLTVYAGQSLSSFESQTVGGFSEFRLAQSDEGFIGLKWSF